MPSPASYADKFGPAGGLELALECLTSWCEALSSAEILQLTKGAIQGVCQANRFFGSELEIWNIIWTFQEMGLKLLLAIISSFILVHDLINLDFV